MTPELTWHGEVKSMSAKKTLFSSVYFLLFSSTLMLARLFVDSTKR